jgi:hypothetical protein
MTNSIDLSHATPSSLARRHIESLMHYAVGRQVCGPASATVLRPDDLVPPHEKWLLPALIRKVDGCCCIALVETQKLRRRSLSWIKPSRMVTRQPYEDSKAADQGAADEPTRYNRFDAESSGRSWSSWFGPFAHEPAASGWLDARSKAEAGDYGDSALNSHSIEDRERRHGSPCSMMPAKAVPSQLSALSS